MCQKRTVCLKQKGSSGSSHCR